MTRDEDPEPDADGDFGHWLIATVLEQVIEHGVGLVAREVGYWLDERREHASGERRRRCYARWSAAIDGGPEPEPDPDEEDAEEADPD